jgi:hypothetical protein
VATTLPPTRNVREQSASEDSESSSPLEQAAPPSDLRMDMIERIANSEAFQKSSRLPTLLRYLATCTLRGDRAGLTEQAIGRAVFDKSADFHPTEDSSVRVYVRQLRLRLHEYYQGAGQDERIVIEIPKGGYALSFHTRQSHATPSESEGIAAEPIETTLEDPIRPAPLGGLRRIPLWLPWGLLAVFMLLAIVGWYRWWHEAKTTAPPWPFAQVIRPDEQTTMVLADGSFALRLLGDREVTLDEYADHHYADTLLPKDATEGEVRLFRYLQASQITSMADAHAVSLVTAVAGSLQGNITIRSAKEISGRTLSNGNFIFVGAITSNPWVELYQDRLNFHLVETGLRGSRYIQNRSPLPGEQPVYSITGSTGYSGDDYATISLVPGARGQSGDILLIQGLRLEGTEAAVRFLSDQVNRAYMAEKLTTANGGSLPHYFEALIHAHSVGGSAVSIDCVATRTLSAAKK